MNKLQVKFRNDEVKELYEQAGFQTKGSVGFDLVTTKRIRYSAGELVVIDFGVIVKPPRGYHTELMSRGSLFKNHVLILTNGIGLIDSDYCGKDDYLMGTLLQPVPYKCLYGNSEKSIRVIPEGTRIVQLVMRKTEMFEIEEFEPEDKSRGGFGSTGK